MWSTWVAAVVFPISRQNRHRGSRLSCSNRMRFHSPDLMKRLYSGDQGISVVLRSSMRMSADAIGRYKVWQELLQRHGDTDVATDAFFALCNVVDEDPNLQIAGFERGLERLHQAAYPIASSGRPRANAHELEDIRED